MGLFLQMLFLILAAALGFVVGWLLRGTRLEEERAAASEHWQTRLGSAESERDRLRGELAAASESKAAAERALREAEQRTAAGDPELEARAARLERELAEARAGNERLEARRAERQTATTEPQTAAAPVAASAALPETAGTSAGDESTAGDAPPKGLPAPDGEPDDLKRISGIGPGIERTLHELGVYHFRQIAAFTPENVAWVNRRLRFKGRIEREDWIGQARALAAGGETGSDERQQVRPS